MSEADPRGYLLVCGRAPEPSELALLTRTDELTVDARLGELERNGVFSRARSGAIYCRRIVRDEKTARLARRNGKLGGNPSLCKSKTNSGGDNPPDNLPVNSTHKPKPTLTYPKGESSVKGGVLHGEAGASPNEQPEKVHAIDARTALWAEMKSMVGGNRPGSLIGKWIKDYGEAEVFKAHFSAMKSKPAEYTDWMCGALKPKPMAEKPEDFKAKLRRTLDEKMAHDRSS